MAHLTAGYSYWLTGDYRLHPENGNLPQRWAALPLLASDVTFPHRNDEAWWNSNVWTIGRRFFYESQNDLAKMLWRSRGMIVLLGMMLGGLVYAWSRRLFGDTGGLVSLTLYALSPTMLANSALVTSDVAAALMFLASLGTFWRTLHKVSPATALASAAAMGLLFVSKMSAVLILPAIAVLLAVRLIAGRPLILASRGTTVIVDRSRQLVVLSGVAALHIVVVLAIIWAFYGFHFATFRQAELGRDAMHLDLTLESLTSDGGLDSFVRLANQFRLLPEPYLYGFAFTVEMSKARSAFLNGEYGTDGWWSFFPYTFLVKTPLATIAILGAAVGAALLRWRGVSATKSAYESPFRARARRALYRTAPLWVFLSIYWATAIFSHINIGHRHILPTYPPMFILCGAAGYWLQKRTTIAAALILIALCQHAVESARVYPHYLAYFNQLAGGPGQGYRHLVDSSLDWGQDLPTLKRWLDEEQDPAMRGKPVYLAYFGTGNPEFYGIETLRLPSFFDWHPRQAFVLQGGTYCISATLLQCIEFEPHGPWTLKYEEAYRALVEEMSLLAERQKAEPDFYQRLAANPNSADDLAQINAMTDAYERFRFGRLCAFLRLREPNASAGFSILIYYLSDEDVAMVTTRPLAEWRNYLRDKKQLSQ